MCLFCVCFNESFLIVNRCMYLCVCMFDVFKKYIPPGGYAMMGAAMLKHHQFVQSLWALYRLVVSSIRWGSQAQPLLSSIVMLLVLLLLCSLCVYVENVCVHLEGSSLSLLPLEGIYISPFSFIITKLVTNTHVVIQIDSLHICT